MHTNRLKSTTFCSPLLLLLAAGPLWAQTTPKPDAPQPTLTQSNDPSNSQYARRILQLRNGLFVRTACSLQDGMWILGKSDKAQVLPAGAIQSVQMERDVLKEWKERAKVAGPGTLPTWCLNHGLLKEGIAQLDRDLGSHALRPVALKALQDYERFLPAPPTGEEATSPSEAFDQHARWLASKNTASLHELAARSLAQMAKAQTPSLVPDEVAPWEKCLTDELIRGKVDRRELALSALAQWQGVRGGQTLRRFAMLDRNQGIRDHAAWLLGTLQDPNQVSGLIAWLQHEHSEVRTRAANALGLAGYPAAIPALVAGLGSGSGSANRVPHGNIFVGSQTAYVQDFDVEVANRSSIADPVVNVLPSGVVLDAGVVSISIERTIYHKALTRITGHHPGSTAKAWTTWLGEYASVDTQWRAPWPEPK